MNVYTELNNFQATKPVVTIGVFDGVHKGHMAVISRLVEKAGEIGGESVVVTLWPHPRIFLKKDLQNLRLLNTLEEKEVLLEKQSVDHLIIIPFNEETRQMSACTFISRILVGKIGVEHLLIGYDHQFGKGGKGNIKDIEACAREYRFQVERLEPKKQEGIEISSTMIRETLLEGHLEKANNYLGYPYFLRGKVVGGHRIGKKIGFPTANIESTNPYKLIPKDGVYAIKATIGDQTMKGMLNIGYRPTIDKHGSEKSIEAHMFDFSEDIYNHHITIHLIARIRDEQKFSNVDDLAEQLKKDKANALNIL